MQNPEHRISILKLCNDCDFIVQDSCPKCGGHLTDFPHDLSSENTWVSIRLYDVFPGLKKARNSQLKLEDGRLFTDDPMLVRLVRERFGAGAT
jgi:rRNA maturation protein Nop10